MAIRASTTRSSPVRFGREKPFDFSCFEEVLDSEYAPVHNRTIYLACENGRGCIFLAQRGMRVTGIDPDRELLAAARERAVLADVDLDLMAGDPLALPPIPEESFGLAVDLHTAGELEAGLTREQYLRQIHRFLMRNGLLIASAAPPRRKRSERDETFAFADPFVSDFTRAGFEVLFEGIRATPDGEKRLFVHARKPG